MSAAADARENRGESTSPGLSSPPSANSPTHRTATPTTAIPIPNSDSFTQNGEEDANVGEKFGRGIGAKNTPITRKPRKKRDPEIPVNNNNGNASPATDVLEKPRKRAPRGTSAAYKKKQAKILEEQAKAREAEAAEAARQSKITEILPNTSLPSTHYDVPAIHAPTQSGNNEAIPVPQLNSQNTPTHSPRPSSGQNYDPIRSATVAPRPSSPMTLASTPQKPPQYSSVSASATPSIYSLIEHPPNSAPAYAFPQQTRREGDIKAPSPPEPKRPRLSPPLHIQPQQPLNSPHRETTSFITTAPSLNTTNAMEIDTDKPQDTSDSTTTVAKKPSPKASTAVSSSSHSPKPTRQKEAPVALPSGSGLLSGAIFGGGYDSSAPEKTAPTVVLDVRLDGDNQYVNFTRLAEERYGFNALHPRLAAQRERLARVAAAGAALENAHKNGGNSGSGDEMSVDLSDGEADNSNVEMGGINDGERIPKSGEETGEAGVAKKPRKRLMKEDMYDKEDDFIDDTELIWEEQAATSKDGFFVYSGPLIPPGEEPTVERAEGPAKRGRGSGRGRGGTTRGAARAAKEGAKAPGRKPRVTKAAKEQMEREKAQRENLAVLASKPAGYTNPPT
ncbi:hypothetical protein JMJ35_000267 [Cladonia borealis]|uniref:Hpc2-related domain-containing protein n=1 Tax=Cladonia borealis TaxID=184061 RepID=A0AA39R8Z7_9LECA|nr:hypothetical protein JMJ35_000267 [Cladonia borealis]